MSWIKHISAYLYGFKSTTARHINSPDHATGAITPYKFLYRFDIFLKEVLEIIRPRNLGWQNVNAI